MTMTYQVTESYCGEIICIYDGIEATDAIAAITRVEILHKAYLVGYDKNGKEVWWTGFDYQARALGMTLS